MGGLTFVVIIGCGPAELPESAKNKYIEANKQYALRRMDSALRLYQEILKEESGFAAAAIMAGKIFYYRRQFPQAEQYFKQAASAEADNSTAQLWLLKVRSMDPARDEQTLAGIEAFLRKHSSISEAWLVKGTLLERKKDVQGAMASYSYAAEEGRKAALAHLRLSLIYSKAGFQEQAQRELSKARGLAEGDELLLEQLETSAKVLGSRKLN